ncbi:MAG: MXAN_5808 family serine peptidase [Myxococcales bacterium]
MHKQLLAKGTSVLGALGLSILLAARMHGGGLWDGLRFAIAAPPGSGQPATYDLTQLKVVNEVLKTVHERYVDPRRIKPKEMLLAALNQVQREVAQVIVLHEEGAPTVRVRVDTQEREFRVDNVLGPWDISARLREIFAFLQDGLRGTEVDLREVEYAACNGMLHTLDPHSVLLSPDAYKEMNLMTSGQFGGLGIVIAIRDQQLTVINPMPGTPAARAGLKKYDRIVKINGESTLNMGLNEAVQHLRGVPGTRVTVFLHRDGPDGWTGTRPFELTREVIRVASLEHRLLDGGVGYVRIKQFQANTSADLDAALAALTQRTGGLRGLVLDLRGNPGGLLDQAVRIADKFIARGAIVATVGNPSEGRDEKVARLEGTEPDYPIVLLVNGSSASASEIVAGAMKNHDRAILIGDTTFGKGSVQLVFTDLPDRAALKLTIAQYLTEPGDVSIQGVGVTPDIQLDPMTVDIQEMDLFLDHGGIKERDLSRSLSNARAQGGQRPLEVVRYALPFKDRLDLRERGGDPDDTFQLDFPIRFGRELALKVASGKRLDQLRQARPLIADTRRLELDRVAEELKTIGVDWSDAPAEIASLSPSQPPAGVEVHLETDRTDSSTRLSTVTAGESMQLKLTVTNKGPLTLYRLLARSKSDNPMFDNKELVIGKLEPGRSRTVTVPLGWCEIKGYKVGTTAPLPKDIQRVCSIPKDALMRSDGLTLKFEEARGRAPSDAEIRVAIRSLERPVFAYSYQIADDRKGNGDGRVQRGEGLTLHMTVKNLGKGRSFDTQANLRNLSGDGLLLREGRFDLSNMLPGETRKMVFTFDVEPQLSDSEAKIEFSIADRDLRENVVEKVRMPIAAPLAITRSTGVLRAKATGADLLQTPEANGRVFGRLPPGRAVTVLGTLGSLVKVSLGQTRFGFVREQEMEPGGTPTVPVEFEEGIVHQPPLLELIQPLLATREARTTVRGVASDDQRLLDAYIFVGSRKVFYRSNRNGTDPHKMVFEAELSLRPGVNLVTVIARENPETISRRTFVVRRDGPNGELLATPKTDEDTGDADGDD